MNKTLLAGAIALTLVTATSAQAAVYDITISNMDFGGISAASGGITELGGSFSGPFNNEVFTATQVAVFDQTDNNWSAAGGVEFMGTEYADANDDSVWINSFNYDFTLAEGEVAVGLSFDWSTNFDIPVLAIFSCDMGVCQGNALPMAAGPFPGQSPTWNGTGTITEGAPAAVPVPAAVWLFGSGLVGLAGIARRRKAA